MSLINHDELKKQLVSGEITSFDCKPPQKQYHLKQNNSDEVPLEGIK